MAVIRQGANPNAGRITTTMGMREPRPPVCNSCRKRKEGQLYTVNANGQVVCADCSGSFGEGVLRGVCDPETCDCGENHDGPTDPA